MWKRLWIIIKIKRLEKGQKPEKDYEKLGDELQIKYIPRKSGEELPDEVVQNEIFLSTMITAYKRLPEIVPKGKTLEITIKY